MERAMRRLLLILALLLPAMARAEGLTVFAASSLTEAMKDVSVLWQAKGHEPVRLSFGASSTLARQIEQGAGVNLFASADMKWMDELAGKGGIAPDTRRDLLGNSLVMVAPKAGAPPVKIGPALDLVALLGPTGRLATGDPAHVPVGLYAEQALRKLGLWAVAEPRLARTASVRAALLLVERGEAPVGIVYSTDAAVSPGVAVIGIFPASSHDPIVYPFAVTKQGDTAEARALMQFITGPEARAIFLARGFTEE
jgi:molybdate transport system substrate-binding protein